MENYIKNVLAPRLQGDGGWIDFVSFEFGVLTVQFQGECSKCLILDRCIAWIKQEIKRDLGIECEIEAIRKKPFFWDT